jgi:hypothetical protein
VRLLAAIGMVSLVKSTANSSIWLGLAGGASSMVSGERDGGGAVRSNYRSKCQGFS